MVISHLQHMSLLLDTNVISELVKPEPNAQVIKHFYQHKDEIAISSIVWHELRFGWLKMPDGQKKQIIGSFLHDVVAMIPILAYDEKAAKIHAEIRIQTQQKGLNIPFVDGQIAAIAIAQGLTLITRNIKDFNAIEGIRLNNWFE